jgi:uncharacterized protein YndB with AHSA1/START domain
MTTPTMKREDIEVFQVSIKATPQAIWTAITDPEWNRRYGYQSPSEYELRPGGAFRTLATAEMKQFGGPDVIIDGEVVECDPPRKLVQTWRPLWDPESLAEGAKRLTWEIVEGQNGVCTLTVTHELANAPKTRYMVTGKDPNAGGGWPFMLEDLKRLLETGTAMGTGGSQQA